MKVCEEREQQHKGTTMGLDSAVHGMDRDATKGSVVGMGARLARPRCNQAFRVVGRCLDFILSVMGSHPSVSAGAGRIQWGL